MATIPQANLGIKVAPPAGIPMASGARGFRVNLAQVIGAQQIPQIDGRAFAIADAANVGQGLAAVGGAAMQVAEAQARLYNRQKVLEADGMMVERKAEISNLISNEPDPRKWVGIAEREAMNSEKLWLTDDLSPDAKDEIQAKSMMWRSNVLAETNTATTRQLAENVVGEYEKRRIAAVDVGDGALAIAQVDAMERDGLIGQDRAEMLRIRSREGAEARQREARITAIETDAAATPEMWLERNQEPGDMSPDEWQVGQSTARRVIAARTDAAASEIGDALASGDVKTVEDIERIAGGRLKPAALAEAKQQFQKMQSDAWRAEQLGEAGVTKNFGLLLSEAEKYDKASDPDGSKYAGLVFKIKTLMPEELRGEITQPLSRKWNPGNGPDAPVPIKSFINETLRNWYADGKFGALGRVEMIRPNDPDFDPIKGVWGQEKRFVEVPKMRDEAAAKRGQAQMEMDKWLKDNPNASIEDAKKQMLKSTAPALLPVDVNKLLKKPAPSGPTVDPATRIREIGTKFGGITIPPTGDLGTPRLTVFGGPNDPVDNGLSAFGGKTGPGGREGVAVPEKILRHFYGPTKADWENVQVEATLPDGTTKILPIADLGTAEWVWKRDGKPVMDLTPGAVQELGGDVIYGKNGTLKGISGLSGVKFRLLPLDKNAPPFDS